MSPSVRVLLRFTRPYWPPLVLSVVLMALAGAAHAMMAVLIRPIFDLVLNPVRTTASTKLFTLPWSGRIVYLEDFAPASLHDEWQLVAFTIIAVFLLRGLCDYFGNYLVSWVGLRSVTDIRQTVYERLLRHDASFFQSNSTGRIMSSVMSDIDKIQVATSSMLADWLRQSFTVIGLLFFVLQADWKLALFSVTVLPIVLVPTVRIGKRIRRTTRQAQDHAAELNDILQETIVGQQVVKAFGGETHEASRFRKAADRFQRWTLRYVAQQAIASPLIEFFAALTIVGLLAYARTQIVSGTLTTGAFTSFVIALLMLYEPVKRLTGIHNIFQQAMGASQRVLEYLNEPIRIEDAPNATKLRGFRQSVRFENVFFQYPESSAGFVLHNICLDVNAGEVVALVGPSGAGKSTMAGLVPRLMDVTTGSVKIDGYDVREVTLSSLRSLIGIVSQDTFLFNTTVAENIRYGSPHASMDDVRAAARNAMAEEFVLEMPMGYDTIIGERGMRLSGGQRQRIAIARALLRNAPILILDEATSHLDTESEMLVQRALANLMQNRTVIVIAHRLSTIRRADKIVVLDQGRITEIGTHDDLVTGGGIYQRLHQLQFLDPETVVNQ